MRPTLGSTPRLLLAFLLAALAVFTLTGCLASGRSVEFSEGRYIGDQTIAKIVPGETTKEWVRAVLDEPTAKHSLSTGVELWKWDYRKVETSRGSVLLLLRGKSREETIRSVYVEFEDDVVNRVWRD